MAQHLNENSLLSNTHDKCEEQLISCFFLSHALSPSPCVPSWEMRSCLKRVKSPTGSQPPRLSESMVRKHLCEVVRFPISHQMSMMSNNLVGDLAVQIKMISMPAKWQDFGCSDMNLFFSSFLLIFFNQCVFIGQYLNLDKDHNGMLSKEELSRYGTATLTSVFLDRVFQECLTYDGEMVQSKPGSLHGSIHSCYACPYLFRIFFELLTCMYVNVQLQTLSYS